MMEVEEEVPLVGEVDDDGNRFSPILQFQLEQHQPGELGEPDPPILDAGVLTVDHS